MQTNLLFYNVENLFDTLDDPYTADEAFLPGSPRKWVEKRYVLKLQRIARILAEVEAPCPGLVGLAEVENRKVLTDLVRALGLSEEDVGIAHADSPDERGMDVGLLYRKDLFREDADRQATVIRVDLDPDTSDSTRDVLRVPLIDRMGERLVVYVTHWPSRREGIQPTRARRFAAARTIRQSIDQTLRDDADERILLMGDLNCTPDSPPVYRILDQRSDPGNPLVNLGWELHRAGKGSTTYRGKWLLFDQILANQALIRHYAVDHMQIISYDWMLFFHPKYKDHRPNKTYGGHRYHGGFSDHLPVGIRLTW